MGITINIYLLFVLFKPKTVQMPLYAFRNAKIAPPSPPAEQSLLTTNLPMKRYLQMTQNIDANVKVREN